MRVLLRPEAWGNAVAEEDAVAMLEAHEQSQAPARSWPNHLLHYGTPDAPGEPCLTHRTGSQVVATLMLLGLPASLDSSHLQLTLINNFIKSLCPLCLRCFQYKAA